MTNTLVHPWMIHPRTGAPLEALGYRADGRPIWPIMGASEDDPEGDPEGDPDDDPEGDPEDDPDDDPEDDPDAGKSPEDLRAELRALRASKAKLLREAKNRTKGKPKDEDKDGKGLTREDFEAMQEETRAAARAELMPALIRTSARGTLESLGMVFPKEPEAAKAKLTRVLKLADTEDLELDDDGEVAGLEHVLRQVKKIAPELFRGKTPPRVGNAAGNGRPNSKPKTATELQAAALFGGGDDDE